MKMTVLQQYVIVARTCVNIAIFQSAIIHFVDELLYNREGHVLDPPCCHWDLSLT
jgi:hypothetical protein